MGLDDAAGSAETARGLTRHSGGAGRWARARRAAGDATSDASPGGSGTRTRAPWETGGDRRAAAAGAGEIEPPPEGQCTRAQPAAA